MSEVPQPVDWYATLGVAPEATESELRTAWRLLARALHPDTAGDEEAAERFAHAREAWENLSDPARRKLLAERAAMHLPYRVLQRYTADPLGDLAAGRYDALVDASLEEAGLSPRHRVPVA